MMVNILLLLGIIAAGIGFFMLSEATQGVGIIGLALFFGVLARIVQAERHHKEVMSDEDPPPPTPKANYSNLPTPMS